MKYTPEIIATCIDLKNKGSTWEEIKKAIGAYQSASTIKQVISKHMREKETFHEKLERCGKHNPDYKIAYDKIKQLEVELVRTFNNWRDAELRFERADAALSDLSQYVSRADWQYLKPETKAVL